jgi:hypothetical protein
MRRALAIAACLAIGLLLGRASAPDKPAPQAAGPASPTREVAGVPVGYPHTRAGAILAMARYQQALSDVAILRQGVLERRVEAIATPEFAPTVLALHTPGTRRLSAGGLGQGVRQGVQTLFTAVPIGYRVLSYSPNRARIRNWGFTLLGNASAVEPAAYFGVATIEMAWHEGDWKIAHSRAAFGPTPRLATPRGPSDGFSVMDLAQGLRSYGVTP